MGTYISAELSYNRKDVTVWERNDDGTRNYKVFKAPYNFYIQSNEGTHSDIFGNKLELYEFDYSKDFNDAKTKLKDNGAKLYESDIGPEYKILSNHYYEKPIGKLNISLFDIEVDYDKTRGFSSVDDPYAPISSVAIHHLYNGYTVIYVVPPDDSWTLDKISDEVKGLSDIVLCKNEKQLLRYLLEEIDNTDVLSGWNSTFFDIPYIYYRLKMVLGEAFANKLSFAGSKPPWVKEVEQYGVLHKCLDLYGRVSLDYLEVFKKFEASLRSSYALEAIAEEELPDLPKIEYDGSLHDLYRENFEKFIRYNIRDTEILKGLEKKFSYINLAIQMSHMSTGLIPNVLGTVKISELAIINYCHNVLDKKVPDSVKDNNPNGSFGGATVLDCNIGLHEMVSALDINSLYPSAIRSLNISPETIIGQFIGNTAAFKEIKEGSEQLLTLEYDNGFSEERSAKEWNGYLTELKYAVSGYGTVFNQNVQGFIPAILEDWYRSRKINQRKSEEFAAKAQLLKTNAIDGQSDLVEYDKLMAEYDYYDRMQYVIKIRLNSVYGIMGNPFFKFYDIRMAESTTRSGREILLHMVKTVAENIDGKYAYPSESIIYGDTDSVFFKTYAKDVNHAEKIIKIIEKRVNESFSEFMRNTFFCREKYDNIIAAAHELIIDRGIFVEKKLYALHLVKFKGRTVDKMMIKGLQIKKTTIPKPIRKKLVQFIEDFLKGKNWLSVSREIIEYKDELMNIPDVMNIGLPKGVNGVERYTGAYNDDPTTRLPGGAAAAIFWNICVDQYGDKESIKITSGMKIKTFNLTQQFGRFKTIAVPTDTKVLPKWFSENFISLVDRYAQVERLIDKPLANIVSALGYILPTKKSLYVEELLEY